jgi:hypothetical protein
MQKPGYQPLPGDEGDDLEDPLSQRPEYETADSGSVARPAAFYGETDRPSAEAEDAALLDKDEVPSQRLVEQGSLEREDIEFGAETRVRRPVLCLLNLLSKHILSQPPALFLYSNFIYPQRPWAVRCLVITLGVIVAFAAVVGIAAGFMYKPSRAIGTRRITMDHIFNGTFTPDQHSLHWVPEGALFRPQRRYHA